MVSTSPQKISQSLQPLVKAQGYNLETIDFKTHPRGNLWRKSGEEWIEVKNLPLDPYHLQRYLSRGFRLHAPESKPDARQISFLSVNEEAMAEGDDSPSGEPTPLVKTKNPEGNVTIDRVAPKDKNIGQSQGANPVNK